jgi:hypothetical protein
MTEEENPKLEGKTAFKTYEYRDMLVASKFSVGGRREKKKDEKKRENEGKKIL